MDLDEEERLCQWQGWKRAEEEAPDCYVWVLLWGILSTPTAIGKRMTEGCFAEGDYRPEGYLPHQFHVTHWSYFPQPPEKPEEDPPSSKIPDDYLEKGKKFIEFAKTCKWPERKEQNFEECTQCSEQSDHITEDPI